MYGMPQPCGQTGRWWHRYNMSCCWIWNKLHRSPKLRLVCAGLNSWLRIFSLPGFVLQIQSLSTRTNAKPVVFVHNACNRCVGDMITSVVHNCSDFSGAIYLTTAHYKFFDNRRQFCTAVFAMSVSSFVAEYMVVETAFGYIKGVAQCSYAVRIRHVFDNFISGF